MPARSSCAEAVLLRICSRPEGERRRNLAGRRVAIGLIDRRWSQPCDAECASYRPTVLFSTSEPSELKLQNKRRDEGRVVAFHAKILRLSLIAVDELHFDVEVLHQ